MTLEENVGQLLALHYDYNSLDEQIIQMKPGCLFFWDKTKGVQSPRDMAKLANRIQQLSLLHLKRPIWLHGFDSILGWSGAWQASLPMIANVAEVEQIGRIFGRRWRAVGLHNFPAPTLNVSLHKTCIMRDWVMKGDTDLVTRYGLAMTRGLLAERTGTMAQHFPAHGATGEDSHTAFPVVTLPRDILLRDHIRPYQAAFAAGCTSICTAHIACPALDPDPKHMATTSRPIMTDFLRGELRFNGMALADVVSMKGFQKNGPPEVVCIDAVRAGCDAIGIMCGPLQKKVFDALTGAVRTGAIAPDRLDEAIRRQHRFMDWLGLWGYPMVDPDKAEAVFACSQDRAFLADINARLAGIGKEDLDPEKT